MRPNLCWAAALAATSLTACASVPDKPTIVPDYAVIATDPAPPNARFYIDCFAQAAATGAYRRAHDGGGDELLLLTCTGDPARAFFEALGPWSARIGSEFDMEGRIGRSTSRIRRNLYGADYCSTLAGADHRCVISFNAGDFLDATP